MGLNIVAIDAITDRLTEIVDCEEGGLEQKWKPGTEMLEKAFRDLYIELFDEFADLETEEDYANFIFPFEPEIYLATGELDYNSTILYFCRVLSIQEYHPEIIITNKEMKRLLKKAKFYAYAGEFDEYNIKAVKGFCKILKRFNLGVTFW